jgi:hypothetical protein
MLAALLPAAFLLLSLAACSRPTQVSSTWHEHRASGRPYTKILVVGVSESSGQRRRFENAMKAVLERSGNTAWTSHRNMPTDAPLERDSVAKIVESTGADSVIVTRLVNHEVTGEEVELKTGARAKSGQKKTTDFFQYDYNVQTDYNVGQQDFRDKDTYERAGYLVVKSTVTLSTDIYETGQGNLIYSVETTTYEKESEFEIIDEATRAIGGRLKTDGLVR